MTITLNHTIVPAYDKEASAQFFAQIFGLKVEPPLAHFAVVRVNNQLTFDFDNRENFSHTTMLFMLQTKNLLLSLHG